MRWIVLRHCIGPNAFGNALGSSLASSNSSAYSDDEAKLDTAREMNRGSWTEASQNSGGGSIDNWSSQAMGGGDYANSPTSTITLGAESGNFNNSANNILQTNSSSDLSAAGMKNLATGTRFLVQPNSEEPVLTDSAGDTPTDPSLPPVVVTGQRLPWYERALYATEDAVGDAIQGAGSVLNDIFVKPSGSTDEIPQPIGGGASSYSNIASNLLGGNHQNGPSFRAGSGTSLSPAENYLNQNGYLAAGANTLETQVSPAITPFLVAGIGGPVGVALQTMMVASGSAQVGYGIGQVNGDNISQGTMNIVSGGLTAAAGSGLFLNSRALGSTVESVASNSEATVGANSSGTLTGMPINGATRAVPLGFAPEEQFSAAAQHLQGALEQSGITDATIGVRGSSVTGYSITKGTQFGPQSDIDFFIESQQLTEGYTTSKNIPGFVHPNKILPDYPLLQDWATTWTNNLGRDVTPGAFTPGMLPKQPSIVVVKKP